MNRLLTTTAFLVLALLLSCSSRVAHLQGTSTARSIGDPRISIAGMIPNRVLASGEPLWITLWITNVTDHELYVPAHFNSNNYLFKTATTMCNQHGDSWGAAFEDFVRLKPTQAMPFTTSFSIDEVGEGTFSVAFHNNMIPDVRRQLETTGVPFVIELRHDFGKIRVIASDKPAAGSVGIAP